jgi:hypothetical protein
MLLGSAPRQNAGNHPHCVSYIMQAICNKRRSFRHGLTPDYLDFASAAHWALLNHSPATQSQHLPPAWGGSVSVLLVGAGAPRLSAEGVFAPAYCAREAETSGVSVAVRTA